MGGVGGELSGFRGPQGPFRAAMAATKTPGESGLLNDVWRWTPRWAVMSLRRGEV